MVNPENTPEKDSLISRLGVKGVGASALALVFGVDSAAVLTAPIIHAAQGGEMSDVHPEFLAVAGVEAVIAIGAAVYASRRARQQR